MAAGSSATPSEDIEFSHSDYEKARTLLYDYAGIQLADHKKDMTYNRLIRRIRVLRLKSFSQYFAYVDSNVEEFSQFINAMTTNLTSFFRENHHFEYLKNEFLLDQQRKKQKRLRIWSAGCSVGEEPYSIAIALKNGRVDVSDWDIQLLATDIDSDVLSKAASGVYNFDRIASLPDELKKKGFDRGTGANQGLVRVKPKYADMIDFKRLNLMEDFRMEEPLDVIFCRNVMIYFDNETQTKLLSKMADALKPDGLLFVGHSESPYRLTDRFELLGRTIYQRVR